MNNTPRPHHSTVVYRWARDTVATPDPFGDVIKKLRQRKDMTHRFPNRRYLYDYLTTKVGIDGPVLANQYRFDQPGLSVIEALWLSYRDYNARMSSSQDTAA